ncbi:FAD-dependent oxidoreductase [Pontibaca methylaminivorans]|uniref:FAD-dependent oxidoreductase n=1 Tax=Pontibaca methylaminivorans TaxID=515897 RepID=UPI002FD8B454
MAKTHHTRVLIIGSGPAGYTAAVYASRAMLRPVLVQGLEPGGQLTITTEVENWPGDTEVQGPDLMTRMEAHARAVGTEVIGDVITALDLSKRPFTARGDYRGQEVVVVGGGNTAVEEALFLTNFASRVTLVHRRDRLRAEQILIERLKKNPKVEIIWDHVLDDITGTENPLGVEGVRLRHVETGAISERPAKGVFIAIGHAPASELVRDQLDTHSGGYVKVDPGSTRTSIPGVFAAGDLTDHIYRQAVTSAGMGCMAALDAERFLAEQDALGTDTDAMVQDMGATTA